MCFGRLKRSKNNLTLIHPPSQCQHQWDLKVHPISIHHRSVKATRIVTLSNAEKELSPKLKVEVKIKCRKQNKAMTSRKDAKAS